MDLLPIDQVGGELGPGSRPCWGPELLSPGEALPRKRGPGQPQELALARPLPFHLPSAHLESQGPQEKNTQKAKRVHFGGMAARPLPRPPGVGSTLWLAAVIFRKSEIKDGWRSGPERCGRRSAGGVTRGKRRKPKKKRIENRNKVPFSTSSVGAPAPPQRGWPAPQPLRVGRGRAPSPTWPGRGACNRSPPGGGGVVIQECAPPSASYKSPQGLVERVGIPGVSFF
jgi:hypothetical protein